MNQRSKPPKPAKPGRSIYIALLRGINVGGKNILPMAELVAMFSHAGCVDVRSYIQSGNVIFAADESCALRLEAAIPAEVHKRFGFSPPVILRTAGELSEIESACPFADADRSLLHVGFLTRLPESAHIKSLDPDRSPGDAFIIRGREIHLCLGNGMGKTKLTNAYFDAKLKIVSTFRNWRTVTKLIELAGTQVA